jgi:4-amino-4-deoxy-L-arabinose transferase-like glycosyltransferase
MKTIALALLAVLTVLRLWLAATLSVTPLDAYYWLCGMRPGPAYFDGPAGTAWLVHFTSQLLGEGPIGLRVAFPLLAVAASVGAFLLGRALHGSTAGWWAAIALNCLPIFNIAAVHAGPWMPALAFTLFAAWAFLRAVDRGLRWWVLTCIFFGFAVQFHYAASLLLAGVVVACLVSHRHRVEWRQPGIYLLVLIAILSLHRCWSWNAANDWPALARGTLRTALTPRWSEILPAAGSGIALLSIFALGALACGLAAQMRSARLHSRPGALLCLATPFLLLWIYGLLQGSPGIAALFILFGIIVGTAAHFFLKNDMRARLGALLLIFAAGASALSLHVRSDPWSHSAHGIAWRDIAGSMDGLFAKAQLHGQLPPILITADADAAAILSYQLTGTKHPEVFLRESQDVSNQFRLWPGYDTFSKTDKPTDELFKQEGNAASPYLGRNALYLTDEEPDNLPQTITSAFARVSPFAMLELPGARKMRVYLCEDYQTMSL